MSASLATNTAPAIGSAVAPKSAATVSTSSLTTRVFQNGNSQALRIPQVLRTDKKEFFIHKIGDIFIAYPTDDPWASARQVIGTFPDDFMSDRNQPTWDGVSTHPSLD